MATYKSLIKASDTSFLEIADLSRGHSASLEREGPNKTVFLAFFRNRQFEFFADQDESYRLGKHIISKAVADPQWTKNLRRRSAAFIRHLENFDTFLATTDFSVFDNQFLAHSLTALHETMRMTVLEFHDEIYPHYSLVLEDEFNAVLCRYEFNPSEILPSILRAKTSSPIEQYEEALAKLALAILRANGRNAPTLSQFKKEGGEFARVLHKIFDEYSWITAAWSGEGKPEEEIFKELHEYVALRATKLKETIESGKGKAERGRREAEQTLRKLERIFDEEDRRLLEFAVTSTETGRVRMDAFYKMFFHAFNLYGEIAVRLNIGVDDLRYMFKEEIVDCLMNDKSVPRSDIQKRQRHSLLYFKNGKRRLFVGKEVERWEKKVASPKTVGKDTLRGQVAYSDGVVEGIAKIIMNPADMLKMGKGDILVSSRTYPDLLLAMKKASAIVTELGGLLSHAAIVARELSIPCVVGITDVTKHIKDGDFISVDTKTGIVTKKV